MRYVRIGGAAVLGVAIIFGAFYLRATQNGEPANSATGIVAVSSGENTTTPVVATDTNHNGIPDWQETLDTHTASATSPLKNIDLGPAPATNTLTSKFGRSFFQDYLAADAQGAFDSTDSTSNFVNQNVTSLINDSSDKQYTLGNITTTDNSLVALRNYGNAIARSFKEHPMVTGDVLGVLSNALAQKSSSTLAQLDPNITSYKGLLSDALTTPVPSDIAAAHLALINAYQTLLSDTRAIRGTFGDPLLSTIRTKRYDADVTALKVALTHIYTYLYTAGVRYTKDEPGALFEVTGSS